MKKALVLGAGGFIGSHLVKRLSRQGYSVRGVDLKYPEFSESNANNFTIGDLRDINVCEQVTRYGEESFDEVYQLAADMGGAGYIFTGENDADIMHNSAMINLNILKCVQELNEKIKTNKTKIFYSSSACVYPEYNQQDPDNPKTVESSVYPAQPDSEYGWEKLFSERLYLTFHRNYGIDVRIARYHNVFGPEGSWNDIAKVRELSAIEISRQKSEKGKT